MSQHRDADREDLVVTNQDFPSIIGESDGIREVCARSPRSSRPGANTTPQLTLGFLSTTG